jgi:hypothetical protein
LQEISAFKSGIWQVQRFGARNCYIAYVDANRGSRFAENCVSQVAFAASEFKNGFIPDEWLQASAQDFVPELRMGNMPGVRGRVIEIEICRRSHCWFPHCAWLEAFFATPIALPPFRAIALRNCQDFPLPGLARPMDCQLSRSQRFELLCWKRVARILP